MLIYLGWITAAFLCGYMLASWKMLRKRTLRESFSRVETYSGRTYREIVCIAGRRPDSTEPGADGTVMMTWRSGDYCIKLIFNDAGLCLGVQDEQGF